MSLVSGTPEQLKKIFINDLPLIDLRAPLEFKAGAFPCSSNLPLMTDEERKKVGTCYKHYGKDSAVKLGHKLVSGKIKEQRLSLWLEFCKDYPDGFLYCFRGGLRSNIVKGWLQNEGFDYPLIQGGYKAMRNFLIDSIERISQEKEFIIIGGRTGTRKTDLIALHKNTLDLEGRANHRGSSFGRRPGGQPTPINFENNLAIDLLKTESISNVVFIEDEGVTVGSCSIPLPLRHQLARSKIYIVEASLDERVENILRDYVLSLSEEYLDSDPENGGKHYQQAMLDSLYRIRKRLGGVRYTKLQRLMTEALGKKTETNSEQHLDLHRQWIRMLLIEYYDPMYDFQLKKKLDRITFSGDWQNISDLMGETLT